MRDMDSATLSDLVRCRIGVGPDPTRVALVLDYRGDQPPLELFELLRRYGWLTPAPHAPPAKAIDWDHPDLEAGRRWSLRPFLVMGALAVPGPAAAEWSATHNWLEHTLEGCGLALAGEPVEVGPLREPRQGLVDLIFDEAGPAVDPFKPVGEPKPVVMPAPQPNQSPFPSEPADRAGSELTAPATPGPTGRSAPGPIGRPTVDLVEEPPTPAAARNVHEPTAAPLLWTAADPVLHQRTISAVIRRGVVGKVVELLEEMELEEGAVMFPVAGHGRGGGRVTRYRGRESVELLQRIQLQVPVDPALVEPVIARIAEATRVGEKGDGKIWVT